MLKITFCAMMCVGLFAQGMAQTVEVLARGTGTNQNEAERAAIRSAVETVVGSIVDTNTRIENDELIEDNILTYSAGYVESMKQVGAAKALGGGLMEFKFMALVKKTKLQEKVKSLNVGVEVGFVSKDGVILK